MGRSAGLFVAGMRKVGVSIHSVKELLLWPNQLLEESADLWLYVMPCSLAIIYSNIFNNEAYVKDNLHHKSSAPLGCYSANSNSGLLHREYL